MELGGWYAIAVVLVLQVAGCAIDRSGLGSAVDGGAPGVDAATISDAQGADGPVGLDATRPDGGSTVLDGGPERTDAGADPDAWTDPDVGPAPATLRTLRWEFPCDPGTESGIVCITPQDADDSATLTGDPIIYDVTLHFRGVLEEKTYTGGTDDGLFNTGGTPRSGPYTEAGVEVSRPAEVYYLNSGTSGVGRCIAIDYQRTVQIRGGATVRIWGYSSNVWTNYNVDQATGAPIVVVGVPPAPAPFDGQFIQVDLVSAVPR